MLMFKGIENATNLSEDVKKCTKALPVEKMQALDAALLTNL